jgi:hypothetical protein
MLLVQISFTHCSMYLCTASGTSRAHVVPLVRVCMRALTGFPTLPTRYVAERCFSLHINGTQNKVTQLMATSCNLSVGLKHLGRASINRRSEAGFLSAFCSYHTIVMTEILWGIMGEGKAIWSRS